MSSGFWQFLIPVIFLFYAWKLYIGRPPYNDSRGFSTPRARQSEKIWNYVQRAAGAVCFFMAIILGISAALFLVVFKESLVAYWIQIAIELVCVAALIPIVNVLTDRKFPQGKKPEKK